MADDGFALGFIAGLLAGIFVALPCGYVLAQVLKPNSDSVVSFDRDNSGRITAITEKHLG